MPKFAHAGEILRREYMEPYSLKAADLARATGLSTGRVSELLNGKRDITPEIAYRLQCATKISADFWLRLQMDYDLYMIEKTKARSIKKQTHLINVADLMAAE